MHPGDDVGLGRGDLCERAEAGLDGTGRDSKANRASVDNAGVPRQQPAPTFVIQKHAATSLHYDFRLEVDGVLKSWAVPKGPSTDPREKRLAMEVEDHALEYGDFEGVIEEGSYGAGAVIVWDTGTYENLLEDAAMAEALEGGHARFWLHGHKLRGGYTLRRTSAGEKPKWLLMKRRDEEADASRNPVSTEPRSVLSGRTIEEVAAE